MVSLRADLEITGGIIRIRDASLSPTDPFDVAVSVVGDEGTAIIKGLRTTDDHPLTQAHVTAIRACLKAAGFTHARWRRHEPGAGVERVFTTRV